ncbi:MAG: glycosyl transferase family 2 [Flavobacteriaceae bacterium]|nr:glycosyl transferase family 2 [Flavobacteriaceae bacterium]|tara:strand:- start:933 stop:1775 length:843 start_codon:yes stop_codon:yes gene_type:complete
MKLFIIIPAFNEEKFLAKTLESLLKQTLLPTQIIIVDDNSTDETLKIAKTFTEAYELISYTVTNSTQDHQPGSKVINAFQKGLTKINSNFDILCKFDADLIFPDHYLEDIVKLFVKNPHCGIAGGFCSIQKNGTWQTENLTNKDHIRGALKAYRKECFEDIGGLKHSMGWDTVDELLARYHGWEVITDTSLVVKHLKPTGNAYHASAKYKQGEAFKTMRYGFWLTLIASAKLAYKKRSLSFFWNTLQGFWKAPEEYIVSEEEGNYIRQYRWRNIRKKLGL